MKQLLKTFVQDEKGSVVQTVLLAAGGVGLAIAVFGSGSPLDIGTKGGELGGQFIADSNTLLN
ncbi:hypothetical protein [Roseovarius sp. MBR-6]|jgi:hypothetical protein|uniref:hypothetical protein n=1 Tax=Roseovarius sp. MBR-6 TaxID=3156459 RepID=UPI0033919ED6